MVSPPEHSPGSRTPAPVAVGPSNHLLRPRVWSPPRLRHHGDLRGLTLGPSPGLGESGNPAIYRVSAGP